MQVAVGAVLFVGAVLLVRLGIEPVPTWFYVFAWYPLLMVLDGVARRGEEPSWLRGWRAVSLFGWSTVLWLGYEVTNLRLQHWYYVDLPRHPVERWLGIVVSFATVLPAIFLAECVLRRYRMGLRWRTPPFPTSPTQLRLAQAIGFLMLGAALITPRFLSPLVWGAGFLLFDPVVYRRRPERSLLADLERGAPGRAGRVLLGGLVIGALWESLNALARGKWIYTVPFLEELKWFEMPPIGFLGFPVFALSAYSGYYALVATRVAVDPEQPQRLARFRTAVAGTLAGISAAVALGQMNERTVSSTVPALEDVPGLAAIPSELLTEGGYRTPRDLLRADDSELSSLATAAGVPDTTLRSIVRQVELMLLRGIGPTHTRELARTGIRSVCELAANDPDVVWQEIHALFRGLGPRPTRAEVRVWARAARRACPN